MENHIYKRNLNGNVELIETIVIDGPTHEEVIAEKEAALLAMYKELEELKQK